MKELKCPNCGNVFQVDEADYAFIVNQVRTTEFDAEIEKRIEDFHRQQKAEEQARAATKEQVHQSELSKMIVKSWLWKLLCQIKTGRLLI